MAPRTVGIIGALCVLVGWILGTTIAPPVASLQTAPTPASATRASPATPGDSAFTARLRASRAQAGQSTQDIGGSTTRNPFRFGDAPTAVPRGAAVPSRTPAVSAQIVSEPLPPLIELSGIATARRDGADQHTAVLRVDGILVFASAGDSLPGGSLVVEVREQEVVLRDPSGAERSIRLR